MATMRDALIRSYTFVLFLEHGINEAWPAPSEECPCCFESFGAGPRSSAGKHKDAERPVTPKACPGYHIFHFRCLMDWLSFGNQSCPSCRHPLLGPASLDVADVAWDCDYRLPPAFGTHKVSQEQYDRMMADGTISEEDKKEMKEWDRIWTARPTASLARQAELRDAQKPYDHWNDEIREKAWKAYLALPPPPRENARPDGIQRSNNTISAVREYRITARSTGAALERLCHDMDPFHEMILRHPLRLPNGYEPYNELAPPNLPGNLFSAPVRRVNRGRANAQSVRRHSLT
jgi:hypothetical protein